MKLFIERGKARGQSASECPYKKLFSLKPVKLYCLCCVIINLCRYIEAVTPMLSALHPSAIIDGLHFQCTSAVEQQNKLKAAQASSQPSPVLTTSEKKKSSSKEQRRFGKKHQPRDTGPEKIAQDIEADVEEGKCQMSRLQVVLSLSKVRTSLK